MSTDVIKALTQIIVDRANAILAKWIDSETSSKIINQMATITNFDL
jgi:hypothetical protein